MKFPLVRISGMIRRKSSPILGLTVLFVLALMFSALAAAQENRKTVVSMSPSGSSQLSWKRPAEALETEPSAPASELLTLSLPIEPVASDENVVEFSPIRPVRLLQTAEKPQVQEPKPVVEVAQDLGSTVPLPPAQAHSINTQPSGAIDRSDGYTDECPDPKTLSSILELSYKVTPQPGVFPESCPLPDEVYIRKVPTQITFTWKASALCHKPLYFEDVQLERYGHSVCPILQPAISGARFWLTLPILPYLMGTYPPNECIYDLGYYRPGSCAPHMLNPIPISLRGGLIQAGATVGVAYLIP